MHRVCPRDFGPLAAYDWGAAMYLYCETCHGVLLEASEVAKVLDSGAHPELPPPTTEAPLEDGTALCSCTGRAMKTVSRDGVTVDVCPSCGALWLDAGELEQVVAERRRRGSAKPVADSGDTDTRPGSWAKGMAEGARVFDLFEAVCFILNLLF